LSEREEGRAATKRRLMKRVILSSTLILLFTQTSGAAALIPTTPKELMLLARHLSPRGFQLQDISVASQQDGLISYRVVSATFLGPGARNAVRYMTFGSTEEADTFVREAPPPSNTGAAPNSTPTAALSGASNSQSISCSFGTLTVCSTRIGRTVVSGVSSSTCPHSGPEAQDRARFLLEHALGKLLQR
jgi:hypothetical protein